MLANGVDRYYDRLDMINIFRLKRNLFDGELPIYDLEFSANDLAHFEEISDNFVAQGHRDESNTWRTAKLRIGQTNYDIEVKLHGDSNSHWRDEEKSYRVKATGKYISNMKKFNLILFEDRFLRGTTTRLLAKHFSLPDIRDDVVVLRINGVTQGLYYLQEFLDNAYLENNECSSCVIFMRSDEYLIDHAKGGDHGLVKDNAGHITHFDYELSSVKEPKTSLNPQALFFRLENLFQAIERGDDKEVLSYFDIEQIATYEAMRRILGFIHDAEGDNPRLVYSASTGKFSFAPLNEEIRKLRLLNGGFEHFMNFDRKEAIPLFYLLNRNDQFRFARNKKLYDFIMNGKEEFTKELDSTYSRYTPYAVSYQMKERSSKYARFLLEYEKKAVKSNIKVLKMNLEYSKMYLNVLVERNRINIELLPDSISQLKIERMDLSLASNYSGRVDAILKDQYGNIISSSSFRVHNSDVITLGDGKERPVGLFKDTQFAAGLDKLLYPTKRVYSLEVHLADKEDVQLLNLSTSVRNDVTGNILQEDEIHFQIASGENHYPGHKEMSFEQFSTKHPHLKWKFQNNILTLLPGTYEVKETIIVPRFSRFIIESGTTLLLGDGVSVVSYSPLDIRGLADDKVIITASEPKKPFATFAVMGEKGDSCNIDWLEISHGNEKLIEGIYFLGALSIHQCDTRMFDSEISNNHADDGLNIKYAQVELVRNKFYDNFADQVDLDYTEGVVKDNGFFVGSVEDNNGDGLDMSGSTLLVKDNQFKGFSDKGVSIGERTNVVLSSNYFTNNNISTAVKDASNAFLLGNTYHKSSIAVSAYQKKPLFGGSTVHEHESNVYADNEQDFWSDKYSNRQELLLPDKRVAVIHKLIDDENIELLFRVLFSG